MADAVIGSQKSFHALFDKYLDHMLVEFEQNSMFQNIQIFWLFDKNWLTIFDKVLMPFWKTFQTETIVRCLTINLKIITFHCSKNYGSPTRATRLKVAPSMEDPISLNENRLVSYGVMLRFA